KEEEDTADKKDEAKGDQDDTNKKDMEIMPPPLGEGQISTYFHVGACAKECLLKGFKLGSWQLSCTSMTNKGIQLSTFGEAYPKINDVFGGVEVFKEIGNFHFSHSWFTTHEFLSELGLRFASAYGIFNTTIGTKDEVTLKSKLKCGFELNPIKVDLVVPIYKEPLVMGYVVAAPVDSCLFGYRTVYNLEEKGFDMHAFCLGYYNGQSEVGLKLENFKNLRGSIFQRIGENWAVALKANLYSAENVKQLSVGAQYNFQNGTLLKVRLRDDTRIGFVFQKNVNNHVEVMYHFGFDLADPKGGAHRFGASLDFQC
ncbi:hypothetical protein KR059_000789, partial [Drosophila kikkawai]